MKRYVHVSISYLDANLIMPQDMDESCEKYTRLPKWPSIIVLEIIILDSYYSFGSWKWFAESLIFGN